jgi:hypothetical protein
MWEKLLKVCGEAVDNLWRKKRRNSSKMLKKAEMIRFFRVFVIKLVEKY